MALSDLVFIDPHRHDPGRFRSVPAERPTNLAQRLDPELRLDDVHVAADGRLIGLAEFTELTYGTSLLVLVDGQLRAEWYRDDLAADTLFLGASMTKSVLAHLVGLAVGAGSLTLDDPVTRHVPELTGYADVTLDQVLTMTSGVDWVEDYWDAGSLASRLIACFSSGGSSRELLTQIPTGVPGGTRYRYNTADSQVLDWVRERATGVGFVDAITTLWRDLGCEHPAVVLVDGDGVALGGGGLAASARDWARLAHLHLTGSSGSVALPDGWVAEAGRPQAEFLRPGRLPSSITTHAGFGRHWWPVDDTGDRVLADGSRGQFCYLDRDLGVVVVKTSQWPYDDFVADRTRRDISYLMLPEIARAASR